MAEYIYTNLPQYITITPRTDFSNSVVQANHVLLFSEDGETLTAKLPDGSFVEVGGGGGTDVSDTTATAATVLSGYDFYNASGVKTSGSIQTVTASLSANVVTVPAGYIAAAQTLTVAEAGSASVSGNVVTIPVGYIASQRNVTVGTAVAAQTITPGTTDQTIASGSYLTGAATIEGDANLIAGNIKNGVTIFDVTGTYSGTVTPANYYKCASVSSGTWTGYKAVLSGGVYTFEQTVTSGLTYSDITPEVGGIYATDALSIVQTLAGVIPEPVFFDALDSMTGWGGDGSVVSDTELGKNVFALTGSTQYLYKTDGMGNLPYGQNDRTMSFWCRKTASVTDGWAGIGYGSGHENGARFTWGIYHNYPSFSAWGYDYFQTDYGAITDTSWHHYLLTLSGGNTVKLYTDGVLTWTWTTSGINTLMPDWRGINVGDFHENNYAPLARFSTLRIYNRVLTQSEIDALAAEYTPGV